MILALLIPYAHLGHWYVQIAFAVPSLLIIGFMWRDSRRRKRQGRRPPGKRVHGTRVPPGKPAPPGEEKPGR
jgi:hypothetical protein